MKRFIFSLALVMAATLCFSQNANLMVHGGVSNVPGLAGNQSLSIETSPRLHLGGILFVGKFGGGVEYNKTEYTAKAFGAESSIKDSGFGATLAFKFNKNLFVSGTHSFNKLTLSGGPGQFNESKYGMTTGRFHAIANNGLGGYVSLARSGGPVTIGAGFTVRL